jgi:tripartite-type tricarboxylate transporter receptor subunit TctC
MRQTAVVALVIAACAAGACEALAQSYPSRPITMIVPVAAGGSTDIVGRAVAERMRVSLGQPVIAENVTGAGGITAVTRLHRSQADGYTILVGQWSSHVGTPVLHAPPFDYLTDFEPVARLSNGAIWVMGRKDFPAKDAKELVSWLKANPGKATAGTVGAGTGAHLCMLYLTGLIGSSVQYVPYRGGALAMQDVASGVVDLACLEAGQTLSLTGSGLIKPYAVLADKRWFKAPDVPTFGEAGVPGLEFPFWHAMWAPKGTPKDIVAKLGAAAMDALADPVVLKLLNDVGHEIPPREAQTAQALAAFHKSEFDKWRPIIAAANIKLK